jgi:hypothetical protein
MYRIFLTFVRDNVFFIFILSIMPLPLLGSVAAGHRTTGFSFLLIFVKQIKSLQNATGWRSDFGTFSISDTKKLIYFLFKLYLNSKIIFVKPRIWAILSLIFGSLSQNLWPYGPTKWAHLLQYKYFMEISHRSYMSH